MHTIAVIHTDREEWAEHLKDAIGTAAARNTGDAGAVRFVDQEAGADLILCLGSKALTTDSRAIARIKVALDRHIGILPIVSVLPQFRTEVPAELHAINGMAWADVPLIAEEVLRHLGLTESDRRIFLSYLRKEATPLAEQLYEELHQRRFSVFLDTFEIEHGDWVQSRIEQALQYTSFVLLLYSPSVETSEWIEKEINFALTEELGLVALALPGAEKRNPFKMTPGDRCIQLNTGDLQADGYLTPAALSQVCLEIEREHADQFRSRRERLMQDLTASLGKSVVRVGSQSIRYTGVASEVFVRLSARPPEPRDFYLLDKDCSITAGNPPPKRAMVGVKGGYAENRILTEWMCGNLKHEIRWHEPQAICSDPALLES